MDKEKIKDKIKWFELNRSGLRKINGGDVLVKNLRLRKEGIIADIVFVEEDEEHYKKEVFKDCEYTYDVLGVQNEQEDKKKGKSNNTKKKKV